jgi:hypothetical protein
MGPAHALSGEGANVVGNAVARVALYGSSDDDTMKTGAFRDPAGNVFGVFSH